MATFEKPPEIPPKVWKEFEWLQAIREAQEALTGAQIPPPSKPKPGDRTAASIDQLQRLRPR